MRVGMETGTNAWRFRQGANSVSTANVTRTTIDLKFTSTGLKTGHYKTLGYGGAGHALGAALVDVAVGFVPAHGALQRGGYRPGLESQFTLGARTVHKHHVPGDFDAFDRTSRLPPKQPREHGIGIGYTQREPVRNFQAGRAQTRDFRERVQHGLEGQILSTQQIALADFAFFGDQQVSCRAL